MMYIVSVMEKLTKDDLAQMNRVYFEKLDQKTLIEVACKLLYFGVHLVERLEQDSKNSSKPPSSDNPYDKQNNKDSDSSDNDNENAPEEEEKDAEENSLNPDENSKSDAPKRSPGKQPGAKGFWRSEPPVPESILPHCPAFCVICGGTDLHKSDRPYMGYYVYELDKIPTGVRIHCVLHHYYSAVCECGHETKAQPGEGFVSHIEGRRKDLKLTERIMVGPMLTTFIAALSVRYRMSRVKIKEFLSCWLSMELSTGSIDRCVREAGVACFPVVEELLEELQQEDIVHLDETPWYEKGAFKWLWVALSARIAVFHIGSRKKEELLKLITTAFTGWLVSDGYMAYRSHEKRQRCLAHLIRKAIAFSGAVDEKAQKMGDWFL
jgi:transposase